MLCIHDNYYSGYYELSKKTGIPIGELLKDTPFCASYKMPPTDAADPCPYDDEDGNIFLYGSCNLFAKALHLTFDYQVFEAITGTDNHWFCKCAYFDRGLYIDIRGATSDFDEFSRPYRFMVSSNKPMPIIRNETDMNFNDEAWQDTGMIYALSIVSSHKHFYGDFS